MSALTEADVAAGVTNEHVIAWFASMTTVNQVAARLNPRAWAEVQARNSHSTSVETLEARANVWAEFAYGEVPDSAMVCPNCGEPAGPCECSMPEIDAAAEARAAIDEANA